MAYRVLTGLNYPPDQRAEVGDIVDDLPPKSVKWLLSQGHIEAVDGKPGKAPKPVAVEEPVEEPEAPADEAPEPEADAPADEPAAVEDAVPADDTDGE